MSTTTVILPDYPDGPVPGFPGDLADIGLKDTISRSNTGTTPISFGAAVVDGVPNAASTSADPGCQTFNGTGRVIGFAKSDYSLRPIVGGLGGNITQPPLAYQPGDMVQVIADGRMRVFADADVLAGADVYVDATGNVTVTATGTTKVGDATWETSTKAGHVGIIQILMH
jgi:hypothetical protein